MAHDASEFSIMPPLPVMDSQRTAAADHKHLACRHQQNSFGLGLYLRLLAPIMPVASREVTCPLRYQRVEGVEPYLNRR